LPLRLNQWANVVRWELRARIFLRTSEFLWQEGHTAHASRDDAARYARLIHEEVYGAFLGDALAMPVLGGIKTKVERFAGATNTITCEVMMRDGKALQMATSHELGQNFARAFDIGYSDQNGSRAERTERATRDVNDIDEALEAASTGFAPTPVACGRRGRRAATQSGGGVGAVPSEARRQRASRCRRGRLSRDRRPQLLTRLLVAAAPAAIEVNARLNSARWQRGHGGSGVPRCMQRSPADGPACPEWRNQRPPR
jgi:tRNA synthetase class II core domain (G, H, P, S and T)